jgi:hypothetical protein
MFRVRTRTSVLATLLTLAAVALAACGDGGRDREKLLSPAAATRLQDTLDRIEQTAASRDCATAEAQAGTLTQQVQSLPQGVDPDLRQALSSGADRLQSLVERQCEPEVTTPPPAEAPAPEEQPKEEKQKKEEKQGEEEGKGKGKQGETPPEGAPDEQRQQDEDSGEGGTGTGGVSP